MNKYPYIKVNVNDTEKARIEEAAKKAGMPVSSFIREQIAFAMEGNDDTYQPPFETIKEPRENNIRIRLSDRELEAIKEKAGDFTVTDYLRRVGVNGTKVISVDVYDDDIVDLEHRLQGEIDHISGIVTALQVQRQLHDNQYEKLEMHLDNIYKELRAVARQKRKERNSIRQTRVRELRKRCDNAIKTETSSKANLMLNEDNDFDY